MSLSLLCQMEVYVWSFALIVCDGWSTQHSLNSWWIFNISFTLVVPHKKVICGLNIDKMGLESGQIVFYDSCFFK